MKWYEKIIAAHTAVTNAVSHSERLKSNRYFVWEEDGARDLVADNVHTAHGVTGRTDLFTKTEFDPWVEELGDSFDAHGIFWDLVMADYEPDTGFYHYSWDWEVA